MNTSHLLHHILAVTLIASTGVTALRADTVKDDFSLDGIRALGKTLNDKKVPSSELAWSAWSDLVFGGNEVEKYITLNKGSSFLAKLPLPEKTEMIQIEASVHPTPPENNPAEDGWIAIGFGNPIDGDVQWKSGIFLLVSNAGGYSCQAKTKPNSPNLPIKDGTAPSYSAKGPNKLKLDYNKKERTINAWINNTQIIADYHLEEQNGTPETLFAGFSGYGQGTNAQSISNFSIVTNP